MHAREENSFTKRIWQVTWMGFGFNYDWLRNEIGGWAFAFNSFHKRILQATTLKKGKAKRKQKETRRQPHNNWKLERKRRARKEQEKPL